MTDILDIKGAMNYLGVKSTTMYKLAPDLGTKCAGWRFHRQVLDDYIKTGKLPRSTVSASNSEEFNECPGKLRKGASTTTTKSGTVHNLLEEALALPTKR